MYRNCHEHPQVGEILKNGEPSEIKSKFFACNYSLPILEDLQVRESIELDEKYSEISATGKRT